MQILPSPLETTGVHNNLQKTKCFVTDNGYLISKTSAFYYFNYSRLLTRMVNFFWHLIEWREKGKVIAPCMKRITPECVSPKIIRWLRDIISILNEIHPDKLIPHHVILLIQLFRITATNDQVAGGIHAHAITGCLAGAARTVQEGGMFQRGTGGIELGQKGI